MALDEMLARPITGIRPFNELPVNAEIWREAHDHHHLHRQLHAAGVHRPGVVWGLEVAVSATRERTIVVAPGIGIDSEGQTVVLAEPAFFHLEEKGQIYITLAFQNTRDPGSALQVGGGQQFYRLVEGRDVRHTKEVPRGAYLELARIYRTGADKPIREASNAFDPGNDELNTLNRRLAFPHCYADAGVGEVPYVPSDDAGAWKPNRAGLWNLLREGNGRGFHLDFCGLVSLSAPTTAAAGAPEPALLYMAGAQGFAPLAEAEVQGLQRFLAGGGLLWGEACGGSKEFSRGFVELSQKLGASMKKVASGHALLSSHFLFPSPPPGAYAGGTLFADIEAGVVFSTQDYGGAWQGSVPEPEAPDARERVRQAQELGLNVVALATRRRRQREISRL